MLDAIVILNALAETHAQKTCLRYWQLLGRGNITHGIQQNTAFPCGGAQSVGHTRSNHHSF